MVKDNIITIFRGDDEMFEVTFDDDYIMQDGDKLVLSVRNRPLDDEEVIARTESYTRHLYITHKMSSEIYPGKYSFDVELQIAKPDGTYFVRTVVPDANTIKSGSRSNWKNFIVNGEVTRDE